MKDKTIEEMIDSLIARIEARYDKRIKELKEEIILRDRIIAKLEKLVSIYKK